MTTERIAEMTAMAHAGGAVWSAVPLAERQEWADTISPPRIYPSSRASRRAVRERRAERAALDEFARMRDADAQALSSEADLAR